MITKEHLIEAAEFGRLSSTHHNYKHGAFICAKNGKAMGSNSLKTHPKSPKPYKTRCAEFEAFFNFLKWNKNELPYKATMYVARYNKMGRLANSKPCKWCQELIQKIGFKKIYYSDSNGNVQSL